MTARQLMKERPMVLPHTARLRDAARLILEHRFRNVPVVDESGRYLGVVSANRLLQMVLPKAAFMERSGIDSLPFVKDTLADFRERWREVASTPVLECLDTDLETVTPELHRGAGTDALWQALAELDEPSPGRLQPRVDHGRKRSRTMRSTSARIASGVRAASSTQMRSGARRARSR